ncbi:MAG: hypothetical protein HY746_05055 [Elusimicrobia bacterium]|nr:hypothetical protein [Elusimicrobiota bacterium]
MIKNPEYFEKFEKNFISADTLDYEKALNLVEAMWEEYRSIGVVKNSNPLEGIESDISHAPLTIWTAK